MSSVTLVYYTQFGSATFKGLLDADGDSGYRLYGQLTGNSFLKRGKGITDFENTVQIGHGGASQTLTYSEFPINVSQPIQVDIRGTRASDEKVSLCIGFNENGNGGFLNQNQVTVLAG